MSTVHRFPSRVHTPSPNPPSDENTHDRIAPAALSLPIICVPDSTTFPPALTVYFPRMNALFSSHSYVVVPSRSLAATCHVPTSHPSSPRVTSSPSSRSHSWT